MNAGACWITGAGGLIGSHLARSATKFAPDWQVLPLTRERLDLTDFSAVRRRYEEDRPRLVIHCAALSSTPACEVESNRAWKINFEATATLCELARDTRLVFFSTDLVFDGKTGGYDESAPVNPLTVYAWTKMEAEKVVLSNPRHIVTRTSLNGGVSPTGDRGFNEQMRKAWSAGETLRLFVDEFRSPIPAAVTAQGVWELAINAPGGLYHLAGAERLSRLELGRLLAARCSDLKPRIEAISLKDFKGVPRSPDTSLNCDKVQRLLSFRLPALTDWLRKHPEADF